MSERRQVDRREFLKTVGGGLAAAGLTVTSARTAHAAAAKPRIKKAVKFGMVAGKMSILDKFKMLKDLGFDGVEMSSPSGIDKDQVVAARDKTGLEIPGVVNSVHWSKPLSHPDPAVRQACVQSIETALRDAKLYGGTSMLLVPAVVNKEISYDDAYKRSQAEIRKVLPLAKELGITIAIENVWNHFLLSPMETARYIDEFNSPYVRAYFDVGNIVNYGWPEHWIRILGKRIAKLDIKEFSRKRRDKEGLWKGFQVELGEGDCDWPAVMKALRDIDYTGWGTAEVRGGDRKRLKEIADRMDRCFAS